MKNIILLTNEQFEYIQEALNAGLTITEAVEQLFPELVGRNWAISGGLILITP